MQAEVERTKISSITPNIATLVSQLFYDYIKEVYFYFNC